MNVIELAEKGWVPDSLIRFGIRRLCEERLCDEQKYFADHGNNAKQQRLADLQASPIAIETQAANEQHYEVPTAFYQYVLGKALKYSCSWWDENTHSLDEAEEKMLAIYAKRAEIENGHHILDLGCGWGSMSLWLAKRFPKCKITSVSNSSTQRAFIEAQAEADGLENINVITCDINQLRLEQTYDRIVSIEMFEHVRNYEQLFAKIHDWLAPDGKLFVHIFCHQDYVYPFETEGQKKLDGSVLFYWWINAFCGYLQLLSTTSKNYNNNGE